MVVLGISNGEDKGIRRGNRLFYITGIRRLYKFIFLKSFLRNVI